LVYGDGANMNALTAILRPAQTGIDLMHYNLHKTFGTPHGGGGPGAGPLAASAKLKDYLPGPVIVKQPRKCTHADDNSQHDVTTREPLSDEYRAVDPPRSIGRLSQYFGSFGVFVRAYCFIRGHGARGLRNNAMHAVLNANYLRARLHDAFRVPFDRINMHEFVCEGRNPQHDIHAIDMSKRLMDFGFHPPTNYFPLIVKDALMIEPTETESKETLDAFADAMLQIAEEAEQQPAVLRDAPHHASVGRVDETHAVRALKLKEDA
jgi:glycine dehydrogenase subunit 2